MKKIFLLFFISLFVNSCKEKDKESNETEKFFPILSYIKSQVAHVDTSLYSIMKIVITDSLSDTTYVKREEFGALAKDFLNIPDLTEKKYKKLYTESNFFDASVNRAVIAYTPNKNDAELRRAELHIIPNPAAGDKISTIILDKFISTKDSNIQKRLLWQVDERFQVVTTIQKPNKPDVTKTLRVIWNQTP